MVCKSCNGTKKIHLLFSDIECKDCANTDILECSDLLDLTSSEDSSIVWEINEAINLLREIEKNIKPIEYTSALGGGVLFKGNSKKDLDIFLAPYNKTDKDYNKLIEVLKSMGFKLVKNKDQVDAYRPQGKEHKHVEIWDYNGKRVDFFFVE